MQVPYREVPFFAVFVQVQFSIVEPVRFPYWPASACDPAVFPIDRYDNPTVCS